MASWDQFKTVQENLGGAEDAPYQAKRRRTIRTPEEYLILREDVFNVIAQRELVTRPEHRPGSISGRRMGRNRSYKMERFQRDFRYVYSGYGRGGVYMIRVRESLSPHGYHIDHFWRGLEWFHKWISWEEAIEYKIGQQPQF